MSAWGQPPKTGAWAAQVDEEEEANGGQLAGPPPAAAFPALGGDADAFPTLGETAELKETKRDRKKRQTATTKMSLGAFVAGPSRHKEVAVANLPTAPRARVEGEEGDGRTGGLGGGFKTYGGDRGGGFGGFDRDEERFKRDEEDLGPSRADAADDWGAKKAFVPSAGGGARGGFGSGGFADRDRDGPGGGFSDRYAERRSGFADGLDPGRADNDSRWGSKKFEPSAPRTGGGFEDRDRGSGGFREREYAGPSKADIEDRWSRAAPLESSSGSGGFGSGGGRWGSGGAGAGPSAAPSGARPRLNLKPRSADLPPKELPPPRPSGASSAASEAGSEAADAPVQPRAPRPNPFGAAKPVDTVERQQLSRTSSSKSLKSSEAEAAAPAGPPKPRANPFGAARPREEVLREKGAADPAAVEARAGSDSGAAAADPAPAPSDRSGDAQEQKPSAQEPAAAMAEAARTRLEGLQPPSKAAAGGSWAKVASQPSEAAAEAGAA